MAAAAEEEAALGGERAPGSQPAPGSEPAPSGSISLESVLDLWAASTARVLAEQCGCQPGSEQQAAGLAFALLLTAASFLRPR